MALLAATIGSMSSFTALHAFQINSGGENGSYHQHFCPTLSKELKKAQFDYNCTTSDGSRENLQRVASQPDQIGFSQLDVYSYETILRNQRGNHEIIRSDLAKECLFMVTKNKSLTNYGQVLNSAENLNFILPPQTSGSSGTFEFLQRIDPDGLGAAGSITYTDTTDEALRQVLNSDDESAITLFVQFPDPDNARFKMIAENEGHFIPVIDRTILRQEIGGEKVYFAEETEITNASWMTSGKKVVSSCTPMVLFTGSPSQFPAGKTQDEQKDLIRTVSAIPAEDLQQKPGLLKSLYNQTKALSAASVEAMMEATEKARNAAEPYVKKAQEATKPMLDSASEAGRQAQESAKPMLEGLEKFGQKTLDKAGELTRKATDKAKDLVSQ